MPTPFEIAQSIARKQRENTQARLAEMQNHDENDRIVVGNPNLVADAVADANAKPDMNWVNAQIKTTADNLHDKLGYSADSTGTLPAQDSPNVAEPSWYVRMYQDKIRQRENELKRLEELQAAEAIQTKSRKALAGAADAIGGIANLWGVGNGGYNQKEQSALPKVYEQYVVNKKMRDAERKSIQDDIDRMYSSLLTTARMADSNEIQRDRLAITLAREKRLAEDFAKTSAWKDERIKLDWAKLAQQAEHDDAYFKYKSEEQQNRAILKYADIEARRQLEELRQDGKKKEAERKAAQEARKDTLKSLAGDQWMSISREIDPGSGKFHDEIITANSETEKKSIIERYAKEHPEWAKSKGLAVDAAPSAPAESKPSATPEKKSNPMGTQKKSNPMGGAKKSNPMA